MENITKIDKQTAVHECVSDEALSHLKTYKYSGVDKSLISYYILTPYWNQVVQLLPRWLAPNAVTLIGFVFVVANVACLAIWCPDMVGPAPSWLYYSFAAGLFFYQTMDNIDGKQARRTGTSSGLGELFDHGIDSLNCTLASLCEAASVGLGHSRLGALTALIPCAPMFFSTWETYHTHTLYLGYFNGPTEGLLLGCFFMTLAGYAGPQLLHQPIVELLAKAGVTDLPPHVRELLGDTIPLDFWSTLLLGSLFIAHMPACIYNVWKARRAQGLPLAPTFLDWTPMVVYTGALVAWLGSPHSHILADERLILFSVTMSFVFGRMTTKIILAHLTRQPFPMWTMMLMPLIGGAVMVNLPFLGVEGIRGPTAQEEVWYLRGYFVYAAIVYFRWAFLVCGRICEYLGINCLTIPKEKLEAMKAKENGTANGTANGSAKKVQ